MRILRIVVKELKQWMRNKRAMMMGVLFPIVMMLVLGTALSGAFGNSEELKDIKVAYLNQSNEPLSSGFKDFAQKGNEIGMKFSEVKSSEEGIEAVKAGKYVSFVKLDGSNIELYKNDREVLKAGIVETMVGSFLKRYGTVAAIAGINPKAASKIMSNNSGMELVKDSVLGDSRTPSAMDYYAVTMLTLTIMYGVMGSMHAIGDERTLGTANRMLCTPVTKQEILIGKVLGHVVGTLLQVIVLILFSGLVFKAYWGSHIGFVLLIAASMIIMSTGIGIGMSFIIKNQAALRQVLNIVATVFIFLGGGYFPISHSEGIMAFLVKMSPIRWVNDAIFGIIYNNDFSLVGSAVAICLLTGAVFIAISSFSYGKEAM